MLGLIMVAGMVPGLLIGLQRTTAIDYDAVAYRTGAILAEDPGWPLYPAWELSNNADGVNRIGLAVAKESPNVLSPTKIEKLFDRTLFPDNVFYRQRIIFGDYPYRFNITLNTSEGINSTGDPLPGLTGYGYIRRVVKIKGESYNILSLNQTACNNTYCTIPANVINVISPNQTFNITMNMSALLDKSVSPAFQYNPMVEPINITLNNFNKTLNFNETFLDGSFDYPVVANITTWNESCNITNDSANLTYLRDSLSATLTRVRFYKNDNPSALPFEYDTFVNETYYFAIDGVPSNLSPNREIRNNISLIIYPGYLPLDEGTKLDIRFTFHDVCNISTPFAHTLLGGTHEVKYRASANDSLSQQNLTDGWLEVAIW